MFRFLRKAKLYVLAIPFLLATLGAGLNQLAVNANHDSMPVLYNAGNVEAFVDREHGYPMESVGGVILTNERHSILTSKSHLYLLCDIIDLRDKKDSVGDLLINAGEDLYPYIGYVWGVALYASLSKKEDEYV